jgi:Cu/Ag efflux protein CusF
MCNSILHKRFSSIFFILLFIVTASFARTNSDSQDGHNGAQVWQREDIDAIVTNIDRNNRQMTLKDDDGNVFTITVDKNVDLSQIDNGDKVDVEYYQSLATDFHQPTQQELENPLVITDQTIDAPEGTEPVSGQLKQIRAVVKIIDIDRDDNTVDVMGPQGNRFEIVVSDPSILDKIKEGDSMTVTYSEALAISVEKN